MATAETLKEGLKNKAKNELTPAEQKQLRVVSRINSMKSMMTEALPKYITADRMARVCLTNFRLNPKLFECSESSIIGAVLQSAQLGLEPILGYSYLIPYGNECQFQIGYKGLIQLFYRSENSLSLEARVVYENDKFEYEFGLDSKLVHIPAEKDRGKAKGYYAVAKLKNGVNSFEYMSLSDVEKHSERYSQAVKKGWTSPWKTDFDQMALKTVIKRVLKYMPLSVELQKALDSDETVKDFNPEVTDMFDVAPKKIEEENIEEGEIVEEGKKTENDDGKLI